MILSTGEKYAVKQKVLSFKDNGQKRKLVVKMEFIPLPYCEIFPFYEKQGSRLRTTLKVGLQPPKLLAPQLEGMGRT